MKCTARVEALDRRHLIGAAALTMIAAEFGVVRTAQAETQGQQPATTSAGRPASRSAFGGLKQVEAGTLNVGLIDAGPGDGPAVILLHGWPYDIHSYEDVTPILAAAGFRVIVPYFRGYGSTRFLASGAPRNGQQAALAADTVALMDALKIQRAIVAGYDWGARTANIVAALYPERCEAMVSVSGYLIGSQSANRKPLPPKAELAWWYQFYFATERGQSGYQANTRDFARLIWQTASPEWKFDDATFERTAASFDNPDHVAIVISNYRWRLGLADGEARYDEMEKTLAAAPAISDPNDHVGGRRQRRPAPGSEGLRDEVPRKIPAPDDQRRYRAQPSSGSAAGVCAGHCRCREDVTDAHPRVACRNLLLVTASSLPSLGAASADPWATEPGDPMPTDFARLPQCGLVIWDAAPPGR